MKRNSTRVLVIKWSINNKIKDIYGGNNGEVPPLPIPNREVKLICADGTAFNCGRVGSRPLKVLREISGPFFLVYGELYL